MLGDDIGAQGGPLVSPAVYRKVLKPRQAKLFALVHSLTSAKLLYHTCGSVIELIDDLIEIGVDVLNPVQVSATNGHGGAEATLRRPALLLGRDRHPAVMPLGTPDEVRAEVAPSDRRPRAGRRLRRGHRPQHPGRRAAGEHRGALRGGREIRAISAASADRLRAGPRLVRTILGVSARSCV